MRVLIVEDNPGDVELVREYLSESTDYAFTVDRSETYAEGLARLESFQPDILLLDLNLPDKNSRQTLEAMEKLRDDLPILVMTEESTSRLEFDALERGADEFLEKRSFDGEALLRGVELARARHRIRRELRITWRAVESAQEGVLIADACREGRPIIYVNPGFSRITGYEEAEAVGRSLDFLNAPETDDRKVDQLRGALEEGESITLELVQARRGGARFWNHLSLTPMSRPDGRITHHIGFLRDVTRRIEIEQQLKQYETIVENATDVIVIKDLEGRYRLANQTFVEMVGRPEGEIIGQRAVDLFGSEAAQTVRAREREVRQTGRAGTFEEEIPVGGERRTFQTTCVPYESFGELRGTISICRDISEQKRMRQRLEYQAMYDALTDLPNRALFRDRVESVAGRALRRGEGFAVAFVDLDDFKAVNDTFGHAGGDTLLQKVSRRLEATLRREDTVARFGGDEFTLLLEEVGGREDLDEIGRRLREAFARPFTIDGQEVHLSLSIGFACPEAVEGELREEALELGLLTRTADRAMYGAKGRSGTTWQIDAPRVDAP
jgi:diguanylate cyclase (GGDEF)-like protein/PAS domain S-box-containing protein